MSTSQKSRRPRSATVTRRTTFVVILFLLTTAHAADGDLDLRFGGTGIVAAPAGNEGIALQADGKILVTGGVSNVAGDFELTRYDVDGSLDETFGVAGRVRTNLGGADVARAVGIQADGKIVVAGESDGDFGLVRYHRNGVLDRLFGRRGIVRTDFGGLEGAYSVGFWMTDIGERIILGGATSTGAVALARYLSDGSRDGGFGTDGLMVGNDGPQLALAVAVQSNGMIVVAGEGFGPTSFGRSDFALARYTTDGLLDVGFGDAGVVFTDFAVRFDFASALLIQPDGKIVAAGGVGDNRLDTPYDFGLARYNEDGTLDGTFGTGGRVRTVFNASAERPDSSSVSALALQVDGKIVAAGHVFSLVEPYRDHVGVVQYDAWGTPDSSFGDEGTVLTDVSADDFEAARAVLVQPDGKILVAAGGIGVDAASYLSRYGYESVRGPFGGVPSVLPGRLQAEDYDLGGNGQGYFDTTNGAAGGFTYRTDDVDLKVSRERGHAIGWFAASEWVNYTVDVKTTGSYILAARVGSAFPGRTFHVEVDGRDVTGPVAVPQLQEWDQDRTVKVPGVRIDAGERLIRVVMGPQDFMDLQWLDFALQPELLTLQR